MSIKPDPIQFSILELENLTMMHEHCKRHFGHEHALSAIAKVKKTGKKYLEDFGRDRELAERMKDLWE